jgi:hypothetical protein
LQTSHTCLLAGMLDSGACCCVVCAGLSSCPHFVSANLSASDSEADLPHFWQVSLPSDSMTKCSPSGNAIGSVGSVAGLPGRVGRGGWEVTVSVNLPGLSAPPVPALLLLWALPPQVPLLQASKIPSSLLFPRLQ